MKNYFIINPNAGRKRKKAALLGRIEQAAAQTGLECEVYFTRSMSDGENFVRKTCNENPDEIFRFFGCGGDGTLNEVVNGICGFDNAVAGNVPLGTGNDFARAFGSLKNFADIKAQLLGNIREVDLIRCTYELDGQRIVRYCDNMINIGFDSNVVAKAAEIRKGGIVTGSAAYLLGVGVILIGKKGADLRIELDNGYVHDGPLLLTAAANGRYCGGGVQSSPESLVDDGMIEVSVIKEISRSKFISLYPSYSKGTHIDRLTAEGILDYHSVRRLKITSNTGTMKVSNDGEIISPHSLELEVVPKAIKFSVPEGL
jgi:diacylglycerol kinase (ATP)